ncbi:hypothetical protein ACFX1X_002495 [Malus domestica]
MRAVALPLLSFESRSALFVLMLPIRLGRRVDNRLITANGISGRDGDLVYFNSKEEMQKTCGSAGVCDVIWICSWVFNGVKDDGER